MEYLFIIYCSLIGVIFAADKMTFHCENGQRLLNVFEPFDPICDGESDCTDRSDEKHCNGYDYQCQITIITV